MATYAVSDLHGQYKTFMAGLKAINLKDDDMLYVVGDVIDRGPEGITLLKYIKDHENMDLIMGNHELMMLYSVDPEGKDECNGKDSYLWLFYNGGAKTVEEYVKLSVDERKELLSWLNDRYLVKTVTIGGKNFCLTHSFYTDGVENKRLSEEDYDTASEIVWNSVFRSDPDTHCDFIYDKYDYTFITGHVPVIRIRMENGDKDYNRLEMYTEKNLINIDGGCAFDSQRGLNNGAIFLRLDDMQEFTVPIVK
ncbi:MAG: fructose-bisphosphatase class III [Lachnospiraceae bacterium]|nr:fructose-bisphosphatase class III [Lachnospiraceae bacterium]